MAHVYIMEYFFRSLKLFKYIPWKSVYNVLNEKNLDINTALVL